jgi:hypothetical protein
MRACSIPPPIIKFYEIKKNIFPSSDDDPSAMSDGGDEGTASVANASDLPDESTNDTARARVCIGKEDLPYINMDAWIIRDVISDTNPSPGKGEVLGGQGWGDHWPMDSCWDIASDDDDFTMDDIFRP